MSRADAAAGYAPTHRLGGPGAGGVEVRAAMVGVDRLRVHPRNVRRALTGLDELAMSIRYQGVLQSLVAHRKYRRGPGVQDLELIAGHRRLAAAEIAGLRRVPVFIVATLDDDEAMLAMLAENTARAAVPVPDLGRAVATLHEEFGYTFPGIAERLGISSAELRAWRHARPVRAVPAGGSISPSRTSRRRSPRIAASRVYELCQRWEAGELDPAVFAAEVRSWLGGWAPAARPGSTSPAPGAEPDWAEVEQLVGGYRPAAEASSAACRVAVRQLTSQGLTAAQIATRLGMSGRQVVRYRSLARSDAKEG